MVNEFGTKGELCLTVTTKCFQTLEEKKVIYEASMYVCHYFTCLLLAVMEMFC